MVIFLFDRVENIVGKGENARYQHVLLFPKCFQKSSVSGSLKVGFVWERVIELFQVREAAQILLEQGSFVHNI